MPWMRLACPFLLFFLVTQPTVASNPQKLKNFGLPHEKQTLLVRFKHGISAQMQKGLVNKWGGTINHRFRSSPTVSVHFPKTTSFTALQNLAEQLSDESSIEVIEANTFMHTYDMPNDPSFPQLYGLHNTGQTQGTADADIDAPEAWQISTGSHDVVVAVIDTGINAAHPDLQGNLWQNPGEIGSDAQGNDKKTNGVDDDNNGYIDDWRGWDFVGNDNEPQDDNGFNHGSHCAGTIGAKGNDGFGVVGVNWRVSMVGVKFLDAKGSGTLEAAVKAIEYATLLKVDIMSNSWGGGGFSDLMQAAIVASKNAGILFVAAAGNNSLDTDEYPHYPSSYDSDNVLAVAATDKNDQMALFSNFGFKNVDLAAPGVDILSLGKDAEFRTLSGTSMATPHVSGAAALIKAVYPESSYRDIMQRILNGVERKPALTLKSKTGGRLNVANALENDFVAPGKVKDIVVTDVQRTSITFQWELSGDDGDQGVAASYELRYAEQPIVTEQDWLRAARSTSNITITYLTDTVTGTISDLMFNSSGYVSIRAFDNVGNQSLLSESVAFAVKPVSLVYHHKTLSLDGATAEGLWNVEVFATDDGMVFSDSPGKWYDDNIDYSLTLDAITSNKNNLTLAYYTKAELEKGYDFGYLEFSVDNGATWKELDFVTGSKPWHRRMVDLSSHLGEHRTFKIRFRIKTDYTIRADGWWIDAVMVLSD